MKIYNINRKLYNINGVLYNTHKKLYNTNKKLFNINKKDQILQRLTCHTYQLGKRVLYNKTIPMVL